MAINLGAAYVDIVPSTRGLAKDLKGQTDPIFDDVGKRAGEGISRGLGGSIIGGLDSLGASITSTVSTWFKRGATVGLAAVAGVAAVGLTRGLGRVLDTEDARVQLGRMGLELAEVDRLLGAVDDTFLGTPFANPDGFNISSQLFATGVELDNIPAVLAAIADVSAHANLPIEQMGDLFTKVAAQGKVTGVELMSLGRAGVPIAQIADSLGMSVEEMQALTSSGEFTSGMFFDAIGAVEMFQGAAQAAGDTTRGAWSNVWTALATGFDKFLTPLFGENGTMVTMLQGVREGIRDLFPVFERWGAAFAEWVVPAAQDLIAWFQGPFVDALQTVQDLIADGIQFYYDNEDAIRRIAAAVAPAAAGLAGLAVSIHLVRGAFMLMMRATPLGLLLLLAAGLVYAWQNSERFREVVIGAFEAVRDFVGPIIETVRGWIDGLFSGGGGSTGWISTVRNIWDTITEIIGSFVDWLGVHVWPVFEALGELGAAVWERIRQAVDIAIPIIHGLWERFGDRILRHVEVVWNTIVGVIEGALQWMQGWIELVTGVISGDWSKAWDGIKNIFGGIWTIITTILEGALNVAKNLIGAAWDAVKEITSTAWGLIRDGVGIAVDAIVQFVKDLPGRILEFVTDAVEWLVTTGQRVMSGFWTGLNNFLPIIAAFFAGLPGMIFDWVVERVQAFVDLGKRIVTAIVAGIASIASRITSAILAAVPTATQILGRVTGGPAFGGNDIRDHIDGNAAGTRSWRGGLTWVGEGGPELVNVPRGARIWSNPESMSMLQPAAGGGANVGMQVEHQHFHSGLDVDTAMRTVNYAMAVA